MALSVQIVLYSGALINTIASIWHSNLP